MERLTPVSQTGFPAAPTIWLPLTCSQSAAGGAADRAEAAEDRAGAAEATVGTADEPVRASAAPSTAATTFFLDRDELLVREGRTVTDYSWGRVSESQVERGRHIHQDMMPGPSQRMAGRGVVHRGGRPGEVRGGSPGEAARSSRQAG